MIAERCAGWQLATTKIAAADSSRYQKGAGFDAVRIDTMFGAVQLVHALYLDGCRSRALYIRAHGHQQGGQVDHLRLPRAILHQRFALSKNRRHEQVFRAGHGDLVENNVRAMQPLRRALRGNRVPAGW